MVSPNESELQKPSLFILHWLPECDYVDVVIFLHLQPNNYKQAEALTNVIVQPLKLPQLNHSEPLTSVSTALDSTYRAVKKLPSPSHTLFQLP